MRNLSYGLFLLTAKGEKDNGCICNTCIQVANAPTRLAVSVQNGNYTREIIEKTGIFNVSILTQDTHFGMQSGTDTDKFPSFPAARSKNGLLYLTQNANAFLSCKVVDRKDLGSHTLFIGQLTESKVLSKSPSCTYDHYHKAIKPKN